MKKVIKKKGLGLRNKRSDKCPHCNETIKAHAGNNYHFKDLTTRQMDSSIGITLVNLKKQVKIREGRGKKIDIGRIKYIVDLLNCCINQ